MLGGGSLTLFRIRGIRIAVDYSWFFVLFLAILWLSGTYKDLLNEPSGATGPYVLAVASALLFFTSIVLHELGHALVAIRNGIPISSIKLWMFGGVARMERDTDTAWTEFKVAVAGPLVTLAVVALCGLIGVAFAGSHAFWTEVKAFLPTTNVNRVSGASGATTMLAWLATINAFVLVFNLLPAFPLDGGRVARAIAWWRTGDRNSATRIAAGLGQAFSYLFIGIAILMAMSGNIFGGIWLGFIGMLLGQSARAAEVQTAVTSKIEGIAVRDVMDREPVAIRDDLSVEQALDEYFLRYRWPWFPVVDAARHFRGLLQRDAADAVPEIERRSARVGEFTDTDQETAMRVSEDAPLESLLANEALRSIGALMAVDSDGRLSGVITIEQVGRALKSALGGT